MTDNYTQSPKWTRRQLFGTLSAAVAHLEEWGACGVMVQRADLEAWATEREELREANARLLAALAALVNVEALGVPGGYIESFPDEEAFNCTYCYSRWLPGEPERHDDDCPVAAARELLEGGE
jgi:hypothetical protein